MVWCRIQSIEKEDSDEDEEAKLEKARLKRLEILSKFKARFAVRLCVHEFIE